MTSDYASKYDCGKETRYVHAVQGQHLLDQVAEKASDRGMCLNQNKTSLLGISAARSYSPKVYVNLENDIIFCLANI